MRPEPAGPAVPAAYRARLAAVCLGFLALTLVQAPGRVVADTKLDLTVDPWGFLGRALQMWEPLGFAGQVQNQAYGYLFPMGPFFGLGQSAGLPAWVVQRLWMALILCVAFLGFVALARRLGIGTPGTWLLGGVAYALAPRMLTGLGAVSIEVWPMAVAPWVLVPLVTGARRGSPRRAAALSGLAVLCIGGVNAVATAAVLPLAGLWLLTRPAGPRRRRLIGWWTASVALATAWWAGPLLLLGRYSPPFLDHIESAATTTAETELVQALRGTSHWVAFLGTPTGPKWPAGWALAYETLPVLATVVLAAAGLGALALRGLPHRRWLVLGLLAGLGLVTAGHVATVEGLLADPVNAALDGVLAPLRNVHKFDPVLRIPLTLALTHLAALLVRRARDARPLTQGSARAGGAVLAVALLAGVAPAAGQLLPPNSYEAVPGYWQEAADWLAGTEPDGRALLLPASAFGTYAWGSTGDEPMQAMASSPWEVRNAVPFTPTGHVRMLDAVEEQLSQGAGSAGLTRFLARSGISHVVVRNDLDAGVAGATRPLLVHRALQDSPGLTRVATFGPVFPAATSLFDVALDSYLTPQLPAVEIFAVEDVAPRAWTSPLADAVTVAGGPDGVLALEERGLLTGRPALLAGDDEPQATAMVSDALVRRERTVGRISGAESAGLTADAPLTLDVPARDYLLDAQDAAESVVRFDGGSVTASSSGADADNVVAIRPDQQPFAALDGDASTAWRPATRPGDRSAPWWQVDSDAVLEVRSIAVVPAAGDEPVRVRVRTDAGERTAVLRGWGGPQAVALPSGPTRTVRLTLDPGSTAGLAEVRVPGLELRRSVVAPAMPGSVEAYAFDAANPAGSGCVADENGSPRCGSALVTGAEEATGLDRTFTVGVPGRYDLAVTAVPRPGPALDRLLATTAGPESVTGLRVTASSAAVPDPRAGAQAAVDRDAATTWTAAADDPSPSLTMRWPGLQVLDTVRVMTSPGAAASVPRAVRLHAGWLEQTLVLDEEGIATFPPIVTDELTVSFPFPAEFSSFDPWTRAFSTLGVGVTELVVPGAVPLDPFAAVDLPCGEGPVVTVDGEARGTRLRTTVGELRALRPVPVELCGGTSTGVLAAGEHRLVVAATDAFAVDAATLERSTGAGGAGRREAAGISRWDAEHRVVEVGARSEPALLVVPENANAGWVATLDGAVLEPRTVDGWQQGYVVPAGAAGAVHLDFAPGTAYRWALLAGLVAVLVLVGLAVLPVRRAVPATGARPGGRAWVVAAAVGGVVLVGGLVGAVAVVAVLAVTVVGRLTRGRATGALGVVAALAVLASGPLLVLAPGAAGEPARQTLILVALSAVVVSLLSDRGRSGTTVRHRRIGRSSST
ncbi:alpha-(1-_3)-arabinofuranosyltransferase [Blastococcus jejuensis]|uniref:Alpha-(1->3)-arabinofuranosyltransferase n=1 Tax=Blastococcus jejuensis TaxID=351224 RepID=A0ABP6P021_9ACTN